VSRISGVHHVAIGVENLDGMKSFYRDVLGFTETFAEFEESEQEIMREVTRSSRAVFSGAILCQRAGGILLELIHMSEPPSRPIRDDFRYGDIGVAKITVAVSDVGVAYEGLKDRVDFCSRPRVAVIPGWGDYPFAYCRDPEGNLVELVSARNAEEGIFQGICSIGISVTHMERSVFFYRDILGLEKVIESHEAFSGIVDEISGGRASRVRSCLSSAKGGSQMTIELFEVSEPRGRSIPFATHWGDFGYLQVAFSCDDIHGMVSYVKAAGVGLLCGPKVMDGGIPDHPGEFVYAKDPDGIPVEFLFLPE
jgi:catechol 2,3-dioxygenase-like lactoylglutathione lyase family enzyme